MHGLGAIKPKPNNDNIICQRIDPQNGQGMFNYKSTNQNYTDLSVIHTDLVEKLWSFGRMNTNHLIGVSICLQNMYNSNNLCKHFNFYSIKDCNVIPIYRSLYNHYIFVTNCNN